MQPHLKHIYAVLAAMKLALLVIGFLLIISEADSLGTLALSKIIGALILYIAWKLPLADKAFNKWLEEWTREEDN